MLRLSLLLEVVVDPVAIFFLTAHCMKGVNDRLDSGSSAACPKRHGQGHGGMIGWCADEGL